MGARPIGSHGDYKKITFPVPSDVARNAREGLALRKHFKRGGTEVGVERAKQLSTGKPAVTLRDIVYIRAYFRRHIVDVRPDWEERATAGYIAWMLWGGTAARDWAERLYAQHIG